MHRTLLILIVFLQLSCLSEAFIHAATDPPDSYDKTTVRITVACRGVDDKGKPEWLLSRGTGVATGPHTILTANHVVSCPGEMVAVAKYSTGRKVLATLKTKIHTRDLATLTTSVPTSGPKIELGPEPLPGTTVCYVSAHPERHQKCGQVLPCRSRLPHKYIAHHTDTVPGNSGSGLYNHRGQLVGVVTSYSEDYPLGWSSPLHGVAHLLQLED